VKKPCVLSPGDRVGIAAPAGPFDREAFEKGLQVLRDWELVPVFGDDLFARQGYLAGIDRRRRVELAGLFRDERLAGVFAARGGYGSMRLAFFTEKVGTAVVHGPVVTSLGRVEAASLDLLERVLFDPDPVGAISLPAPQTIRPGAARGPVKGGNLSVLTRLVGTPFMPDLRGAILFFEDVGERPYRIDRMLTHLRLAGALAGVAGVLVGELVRCEEPNGEGPTAAEVVRERLADLGVPVLAGFPAGHGAWNHPLPFGLPITLDATGGRVVLEEGFADLG
jgi:muramoyltetrapeptide carboxypeptidase